MKVVIDISEDVLKRTVFYREFRDLNDCVTVIKALEKAVPLSEDCVSRKAVHDMLENVPINPGDKWFNWLQKACLRLADLPDLTEVTKG